MDNLKVLVIEDNRDHFDLIEDALSSIQELHPIATLVSTTSEAKEALDEEVFDVCLCDLQLPDSNIAQTIEWLSVQKFPCPVIILTSLDSLDIAKELLSQGVQDYIPKCEITGQLLYRTCRYAIDRWKHQQEIEDFNRDMQAFCSSLSHDFSAHIGRIRSISEVLKNDLGNKIEFSPTENQWFSYLDASTQGIQSLVIDLQHYLSVGYSAKDFDLVDINSELDKVVASLRTSLDLDFEINIQNSIPLIYGNPAFLHVMFHNLIANGIKFNKHPPVINIKFIINGNNIEISVEDNGIGFDENKSDTIFSPFKRLNYDKQYGGSGLGLSIVKRIVDHHQGSIKVKSAVDKGSVFTIRFSMEHV